MGINLNNPAYREEKEKIARGEFSKLPPGTYLMRCSDVVFKEGDKGASWRIVLKVAPGEPHDGDEVSDFINWGGNAKSLSRALLILNAFGLRDEELTNVEPSDSNCQKMLIGRLAIVTVENGKPNEKGNIFPRPTYAGYASAVQDAVDNMRRERASGAASNSTGAAPGGGGTDYGEVPF